MVVDGILEEQMFDRDDGEFLITIVNRTRKFYRLVPPVQSLEEYRLQTRAERKRPFYDEATGNFRYLNRLEMDEFEADVFPKQYQFENINVDANGMPAPLLESRENTEELNDGR